jgi:hypothetical protein
MSGDVVCPVSLRLLAFAVMEIWFTALAIASSKITPIRGDSGSVCRQCCCRLRIPNHESMAGNGTNHYNYDGNFRRGVPRLSFDQD